MSYFRGALQRIVGLLLLTDCGRLTLAAEPPSIQEIVAGMRHRESQITDLELRFQTHITRTDFYFELIDSQARQRAEKSGRPQSSPHLPREETHTYELLERLPRSKWSQFASDGAIESMVAFDGAFVRSYQAPNGTSVRSMVFAAKAASPPGFVRPDELSRVHGKLLSDLLAAPESQAKIQRQRVVDGEQLADLELIRRYPTADRSTTLNQHIQATVNVSRQFWPVFVRSEFERSAIGELQNAVAHSAQEISARGWLTSGRWIYPRHVELRQFNSLPSVPEPPVPPGQIPRGQLCVTQTLDMRKVVINTGIPDSEFVLQFPVGTIYSDMATRKFYEVDPTGKSTDYIPRPRGLRGTVFAYHLCWITALAAYGIWRRSGRPQ